MPVVTWGRASLPNSRTLFRECGLSLRAGDIPTILEGGGGCLISRGPSRLSISIVLGQFLGSYVLNGVFTTHLVQ